MSEIVNTPAIAMMFSIGAFVIALICLHKISINQKPRKHKIPKPKKTRHSDVPFGIRPEFIEEAKKERAHRMAQRKKYGIFDENGNRIDKP